MADFVQVNLQSRDFVKLASLMKADAIKRFGYHPEASDILGKQVPYTPFDYAQVTVKTWGEILSKFLPEYGKRRNSLKDQFNAGPIKIMQQEDLDGPIRWPFGVLNLIMDATDTAEKTTLRRMNENGKAFIEDMASQFFPIVGGSVKNAKGRDCMVPHIAAGFWRKVSQTGIDAGLFDFSISVPVNSFWAAYKESAVEIANDAGKAAGQVLAATAETVGNVAGNVAKGFLGGIGVTGAIVVVGAGAYVAHRAKLI